MMVLGRASLLLLVGLGACTRAGYEATTSTAPLQGDAALPRTDATTAPDSPDFQAIGPGTRTFGGAGDPGWTALLLENAQVVQGSVQLGEQTGFGLKTAQLPAGGAWGAAAAHQKTIYLFGGGTKVGTLEASKSVLGYQPGLDAMVTIAPLPQPLLGAQAVAAGGTISVVMGIDPTLNKSWESQVLGFDPLQSSISVSVQGLYAAYHHASALGSNGLIYSFGGYGSGPLHDTIEAYDPGKRVVVAVSATLPSPREKLAAFAAANGSIYLFGGAQVHGATASTGSSITDQILRFTPAASAPGPQPLATRLPQPLINLAGGVLPDGQIYLAGGDAPGTTALGATVPTDSVYRFDPITEKLTVLADKLPQALGGAAAAVGDNGKLYLFGGLSAKGLSTQVLELHPYQLRAVATGPVIDTGAASTPWLELLVTASTPPATALGLAVRAGNDPFQQDAAPAWQVLEPLAGSPAKLPAGRYLQWRAVLTTTNTAVTPALQQVLVRYGSQP